MKITEAPEEQEDNGLNEAQRPCNCPGILVPVYWVSSLEVFLCCNCDGFVGSLNTEEKK